MCGVCGIFRPTGKAGEDDAAVAAINQRQRHRGPDDQGRWGGADAVFGHTRLSIVDLTAGGHQPFISPDGSVVVVFNGEIYNHQHLRDRYQLGVSDRCDGAILPPLWQRLGTSMFAELRGMYAIAIYDARARTVTLARDTFGIKPLYWAHTPDGALAFASEPRSLLPLLPRPQLNATAIRHYLMFGAMSGGQAPFRDVHPVPANSWVQWDQAMRRTQGTGWAGVFDDLGRATTRQLRDEFLQSISLHLLSDVPVGLLLSSGLDSAAVAWACAELGKSLVCITADMGDAMAEGPASRHVATRFGHRHEIVSAVPDSDIVQRYFAAMQRPSIDGLNTFLVSKAVADLGLKVALSGLGADETLAGYALFRRLRYLSLLRFADVMHANRPLARLYHGRNEKLAGLLDSAGPRDAVAFAALCRRVLMDDQVEALVPGVAPVASVVSGGRDTSARALSLAEIDGYLRGTLLPDTDAFSMAWSVEMRVPYVDVPFTRTALAVDPRRGVGKQRFAAALGDTELRKIAERRKRGFTLPMESWMRSGPLLPYVRAVRSADAPVRGVLDVEAIDHLMARWSDGMVSWPRAWSVVSLNAWLQTLNVDGVSLDLTEQLTATTMDSVI